MYVYLETELEIKSEKNQLLLSSSSGTVVLAYKEPLRFQVWHSVCDAWSS